MLNWLFIAIVLWVVAAFFSIYARCSFYCQQVIFHWRYLYSLLVRRSNIMTEILNALIKRPPLNTEDINEVIRLKAILNSPMSVDSRSKVEHDLEKRFTQILLAYGSRIPADHLHLILSYEEVQSDIRQARMSYNGVVRDLLEVLSEGPDASFAPIMGFKPAYYFQLEDEMQEAGLHM